MPGKPDAPAADQVADLEFDQIAATKLAVDREIEKGAVSQALVLVEIKPDCPDIARFQRALGSDVLASIPGTPFMHCGVEV